jgi:hypothetical protein
LSTNLSQRLAGKEAIGKAKLSAVRKLTLKDRRVDAGRVLTIIQVQTWKGKVVVDAV